MNDPTTVAQQPVAWRIKHQDHSPWSMTDDPYYVSCKRGSAHKIEALYNFPVLPERPKEPSPAQLSQLIDGVDRSHTRKSAMEFLRVWIRDWTLNITDTQKAYKSACGIVDEQDTKLAELEALNNELLAALNAYRKARAMSSYGDYAQINWESQAGPVNPAWGGGDCAKHGRWYGRCYCCLDEWDKLRKQADRDAVHARDNALRAADEKARAIIDKIAGAQP